MSDNNTSSNITNKNNPPGAGCSGSPPTSKYRLSAVHREEHEAFKNRLVDDVLGESSGGKVPMEKVVMLIWSFRDDPAVITFMARFMAKYAGVRDVLDGIEFYLPQLAHMIIHLDTVEWDDAILERFALVIAQQSIHFALQLNWILQGALHDYQPECADTGEPNDNYNPLYYTRCLKLLKNVERCVVYGKPRSQELQRLYEQGEISRSELQLLEHADRRFNALQITTKSEMDDHVLHGELDGWLYIQMPIAKKKIANSSHGGSINSSNGNNNNGTTTTSGKNKKKKEAEEDTTEEVPGPFVQRFCVLDRHVLTLYLPPKTGCKCSGELKLDRAFSLEHAIIHSGNNGNGNNSGTGGGGGDGNNNQLTIQIERPDYIFQLRCSSMEDKNLWTRRLQEEAHTSVLFSSPNDNNKNDSGDQTLRADLTPTQLDRYDLFQNERNFVTSLTDIAEELRFKTRVERKQLAPVLMEELHIPDIVYLPLCNSSDIWRRVDASIAEETRVFNTKERCPIIMHFISKRGEKVSPSTNASAGGTDTTAPPQIDPNLDVAEFLHIYFDVTTNPTENNNVLENIAEEENQSKEVVAVSLGGGDAGGGAVVAVEAKTPAAKQQQQETETTNEDRMMKTSEHGGPWNDGEEDDENTAADAGGAGAAVLETPSKRPKGNSKVQRLLRESVVTMPRMLSKRLGREKRQVSVVDRQTELFPMVPIIEGRDQDNADNASVGDGTVVSVEKSSVLTKDRIVYGGSDEGNIDVDSINRAKQFVSHGESWAEKSAKMLEKARKDDMGEEKEGNLIGVQLEIASCMAKSNDDLRQEVFVMQMIHYFKSVFAQAKLPLWLRTYRILSCSSSTGLLEVLVDATSLDGLKKHPDYPTKGGLRRYFEITYGGPDSNSFKAAQTNFMQSLAAYALVSYLLGLKDRHNGNIMIDTRGHLINIDFGFAMGMAPGHEFSFERAPFKLTKEYVEVMGGVKSDCYKEFQRLFVAGFEECRKNSQIALGMVEIMMYKSNYPCFSGYRYGNGRALAKFEKRLMLRTREKHVQRKALRLIRKSRRHFGTYAYDAFQKATNGYAI